MAEPSENKELGNEPAELPDFVKAELQTMTSTERAAVLMLLMGETQAADIIKYMSPREVQALGSSMVGVVDLSQETVSAVLDDFVSTIKQQTNLGLGTTDYVESVLKRALGDDKASTVLGRICPAGRQRGWKFSAGWIHERLPI